jgi:hypothetical protein
MNFTATPSVLVLDYVTSGENSIVSAGARARSHTIIINGSNMNFSLNHWKPIGDAFVSHSPTDSNYHSRRGK